jgi:hypothetical protein
VLNPGIARAEKNGLFKGDELGLVTYLDALVQAPIAADAFARNYKKGDDIVKARVDAYRRSDGSIDAVGFGNSEARLTADQARRASRIEDALKLK